MGRVTHKTKRKESTIKLPSEFHLTLDERLRILANLIIDRLLEDQKNGISRINNPNQT